MRIATAAVLFLGLTATLEGQVSQKALKSLESIGYQYLYALAHEIPFLETPKAVDEAFARGELMDLRENPNLRFYKVSYYYVKPSTKIWLDKFEFESRPVCGDELWVTSAMRPVNMKLWNSSPISVHPTGMAVDLRIPKRNDCYKWFLSHFDRDKKLGLIDYIIEKVEPNFHVAVLTTLDGEDLVATR